MRDARGAQGGAEAEAAPAGFEHKRFMKVFAFRGQGQARLSNGENSTRKPPVDDVMLTPYE